MNVMPRYLCGQTGARHRSAPAATPNLRAVKRQSKLFLVRGRPLSQARWADSLRATRGLLISTTVLLWTWVGVAQPQPVAGDHVDSVGVQTAGKIKADTPPPIGDKRQT